MLRVSGLNQYYAGSHTLWDVELDVAAQSRTCLMGRNGMGKTTLLKCIMGLLPSASGEIRFDGRDLHAERPEARARLGIGYVPQGREIFPQLTVEENLRVGLGVRRQGSGGQVRRHKRRVIPPAIYDLFPILKTMRQRRGGDLSGGQQQQLAIGRALVLDPSMLILDEPTEGIQPNIVHEIGDIILATTGVDVSITGLDRVKPGETYVFISNHQSIYDIPVIFASLPFQLRIIAKESLGRFPFLGWHLIRAGHLLVDRRNPKRSVILNRWRRLVGDRLSLIIFPEGTRSADGRVGRFKAGSFLLALETGLTIVPLSISGTMQVMKKGRLTTCPGQVTLQVHDPIPTPRAESPTADEARDLAARIEEIVRKGVEA